jgi:predicted acylesterase/phospholipase RssA
MSDRRRFLGALGAAAFLPGAADATSDAAAERRPKILSHALVLSGGGARGAYEAGIVAGLARRGGIADGQVLAPYGLVCGTSIGALNAWFVATGQYEALARGWQTIAASNVIQLKSKYVTLDRPHAFIGVRIRAALRLATGLTKNEMGLARSEPVLAWMKKFIDPTLPVLVPMVWAVTNLTTQSPEYFFRLPASLEGPIPVGLRRAFELTLGPEAIVRPASDEILREALFASVATPIIFDPVVLKMASGGTGLYVDGGIASNANIRIARTLARAVDVVLLDPRSRNEKYANAVDVVMGSYETMQRKILETEMRDVYFESLGSRALGRLGPSETETIEHRSPEMRTFISDLPATELAYMRPKTNLPVGFASFDDQGKIDAAFEIGDAQSEHAFTPYTSEGFRL